MDRRRAAAVVVSLTAGLSSLGACRPAPAARDAAPSGAATPAADAGTASLPAGHPPIAGAAGPAVDGGELAWTRPEGWNEQAPTSSMRRAQYEVPGPSGAAECVVFYFGPGQGGDAESNAERWASQFTKPDGAAAEAKTTTLEVGTVKVVLVEVAGTLRGGSMGGPPPAPRPGSMLLGAIAQGPDANWFFKLTGPEKTVQGQRAAFMTMIRSIRTGG